MILTIIKYLVWIAAVVLIALVIVYGFYLILIFMLFGHTFFMWLAIAGEVLLWIVYWLLLRIAE